MLMSFDHVWEHGAFIRENAKGVHGEICKFHTSVISTQFFDQVQLFFFFMDCIVISETQNQIIIIIIITFMITVIIKDVFNLVRPIVFSF